MAAACLLLWWGLIDQLRIDWEILPQYSYGWAVAPLMLWLLYRRWTTRPSPMPAGGFGRLAAVLMMTGIALGCAALGFFEEAARDFRPLSWLHAALVCAFMLAGAFLAGGWKWLRHFAFPFLFFLVAVPWLLPMENAVIQASTRLVGAVSVETLNLFGIPAIQRGNLIEVASGILGEVEDACSGIRSLQATLMLALFLGELRRLAAGWRLVLLAAGVLLAVIQNVLRTSLLAWVGATSGQGTMSAFHDFLGFAFMFAGFFAVLKLVELGESSRPSAPLHAKPTSPVPWRPWPPFLSVALLAILVSGGIFTEWWFRAHAPSMLTTARWEVQWPKNVPDFQPVQLSPHARTVSRFDRCSAASWTEPDGSEWMVYLLEWLPDRTSTRLGLLHNPAICLPAGGRALVADRGPVDFEMDGQPVSFHRYQFDQGGAPLHVYYCRWEQAVPADPQLREGWSSATLWDAARIGKRNSGQQVIEVIIGGIEDADAADAAVRERLPDLFSQASPGSAPTPDPARKGTPFSKP